MEGFRQEGQALIYEQNHETVRLEPWGADSLRVRASAAATLRDHLPGALLAPVEASADIVYDFRDPACGPIEDEFMFGPDLLVAPVLYEGERARSVYLPADTAWTDAWNGEVFAGGQSVTAAAPLERIPLYLRAGATLPIRGGRQVS